MQRVFYIGYLGDLLLFSKGGSRVPTFLSILHVFTQTLTLLRKINIFIYPQIYISAHIREFYYVCIYVAIPVTGPPVNTERLPRSVTDVQLWTLQKQFCLCALSFTLLHGCWKLWDYSLPYENKSKPQTNKTGGKKGLFCRNWLVL